MTDQDGSDSTPDRSDIVGDRLVFPLLVPIIVFLFAVLVIYGLSRIYLELNTISVGDVTMATPLAIVVSLFILFSAWFLASNRRVPMFQVAGIGMIAVGAITGGAIWAAVDDREENGDENHAVETPIVEEGTLSLELIDFEIEVAPDSIPAGEEVTLKIANMGSNVHNIRIINTGLAPDALPLDASGTEVDLAELSVVYETAQDISPDGESEDVLTLDAGSYVVICNVPGHYDFGMFTALTVE